MSTTDNGGTPGYVQTYPPSPSRMEVQAGGYTAAFYPGFVSGVRVEREGVPTELYAQTLPFVLPAGALLPWDSSEFVLRGGPNAREIGLVINDPLHEIASIEIRLKPKGAPLGYGPGEVGAGDGETVLITETPIICPPICEIPPR